MEEQKLTQEQEEKLWEVWDNGLQYVRDMLDDMIKSIDGASGIEFVHNELKEYRAEMLTFYSATSGLSKDAKIRTFYEDMFLDELYCRRTVEGILKEWKDHSRKTDLDLYEEYINEIRAVPLDCVICHFQDRSDNPRDEGLMDITLLIVIKLLNRISEVIDQAMRAHDAMKEAFLTEGMKEPEEEDTPADE